MAITGLLSLKEGDSYFSLHFQDLGWMAADLVQYLDDVLASPSRRAAILKLLGFTLRISAQRPRRQGNHWVFVDLNKHELETNSDLIRLAVEQKTPAEGSPYSDLALRRIYQTLDQHDFTVKFYS